MNRWSIPVMNRWFIMKYRGIQIGDPAVELDLPCGSTMAGGWQVDRTYPWRRSHEDLGGREADVWTEGCRAVTAVGEVCTVFLGHWGVWFMRLVIHEACVILYPYFKMFYFETHRWCLGCWRWSVALITRGHCKMNRLLAMSHWFSPIYDASKSPFPDAPGALVGNHNMSREGKFLF